MTHCTTPYRLQGSSIAAAQAIVCLAILCPMYTGWAQTDRMLEIARRCEVAVTYVAPGTSGSAVKLRNTLTRENSFSLEKQFSDGQLDVTLRFMKYDSHLELSGAAAHAGTGDICVTLSVIMPLAGTDEVTWCHDLDSAVVAAKEGAQLGNFVDASTVHTSSRRVQYRRVSQWRIWRQGGTGADVVLSSRSNSNEGWRACVGR